MPSLGGGGDGWIAGVKNRFTDISDLLGLAARSTFAQAMDIVSDATRLLGIVTIRDGGNIISVDDAGGSLTIDDGGGSITVDGAITIQEPLPVLLQDPDDDTRRAEFDAIFQIPVVIDVVHHEIHEGDAYFYSELVALAGQATRDLLIVSPDSLTQRCHFFFDVQANDEVNVVFYEDPTITNPGTVVVEVNRHRSSANTANTVVTHTPTVGAAGTQRLEFQIGGAQGKQSGGPGPIKRPEIILDVSQSEYLLRITAANNNTDVSIWLDWYEHTDE